jgi:hypothetical protein
MTRTAIVALGVLVIMAACKPSGSSGGSPGNAAPLVDDSQALQEIGFAAPILVSADTSLALDGQGNFITDQNTKLLDAFLKAGVLGIDANMNGNPWWTFTRTNNPAASFNGGIVSVPVATRQISKRSDQKTWTEGSVNYFAETVTYTIAVASPYTGGKSISLGPFSLRLVLVNDPAVGHWSTLQDPQRGTHFDTNDVSGVPAAITQGINIGDIVSAAQKAQQRTYQAIQDTYMADGRLEQNAKQPDVLVSQKLGMAYYARSNRTRPLPSIKQLSTAVRSTHRATGRGGSLPRKISMPLPEWRPMRSARGALSCLMPRTIACGVISSRVAIQLLLRATIASGR